MIFLGSNYDVIDTILEEIWFSDLLSNQLQKNQ
jgi:hypothetical protein